MDGVIDFARWVVLPVLIWVVAFGALIVGAANGVAYGIDRPACHANTARMGMQSSWSFWGGCQIRLKDGSWLPLENYRVIGGAQ